MHDNSFFKQIDLKERSAQPKYIQVANAIETFVKNGIIKQGELLPSINQLNYHLNISRPTAERIYTHLRKKGLINSFPGKGFCVNEDNRHPKRKILLLLNKLSIYKKMLYDAFVAELGEDTAIDLRVYNDDLHLFSTLLTSQTEYSHYVVMPVDGGKGQGYVKVLNQLPKDKLLILGQQIAGIKGLYASVVEDHEKDIYRVLHHAQTLLAKYDTLTLVVPGATDFPQGILNGFQRFCQQKAFKYNLVKNIRKHKPRSGEAFIVLSDDDLVVLVESIAANELKLGKEVGIISYNELAMKKIMANGITTISTDFEQMGLLAAQQICNESRLHMEVPFHLVKRNSL